MSRPAGSQRYSSAYGATRPLTAAQKLAEMICERQAIRQGRQLPARFWETPEWKKQWHLQIVQVNALLKLYSAEAIFRALEETSTFSFGAPFFKGYCEESEKVIQQTRQRMEETDAIPNTSTSEGPRRGVRRGQSARDKLGE